jgi:hypothetical protein
MSLIIHHNITMLEALRNLTTRANRSSGQRLSRQELILEIRQATNFEKDSSPFHSEIGRHAINSQLACRVR